MRVKLSLAPLVLALALFFAFPVLAPATPTYTLTVSPSVPLSCRSTATITLTLTNGQSNSAYTETLDVRKPNGTGQAITTRVIATDNRGFGSVTVPYPDASFTPISPGTVETDVAGVYNVIANQTSPTNIGIVATAQFTVSCQLTVVVSQPVAGSFVERGRKITLSATVSDLSGPISSATVKANSPRSGGIILPETSPGAYSIDYQVQVYDPLGSWTIQVQAADSRGNSGTSNPVAITIAKSQLVVDALVAYNSKGVPSTDFAPGDTVYPFFRVRYSSGDLLTSGQFRVSMKNPSGTTVSNLTAVYDAGRFGFYAPTGFAVSAFDTAGSWTVVIDATSIDDGFGNTGPGLATSVRIQIVTSPLGYLPFIIGGIVAAVGGVVAIKRFETSTAGFEHLEQLMGGQLPRASSLLLLGDPGSGKTILSYQLLWDELESGRQCALLSYDAFPEDVQARMKEFVWDIIPYLRKGRLKIIDCYSGLAGEGQGAIRDPSDLTELNIQVTSFIAKAKGAPVTLVLDSLTPIFNGVEGKQAINFVQTIAAKVKKTGGLLVLTASTGAVPSDAVAKIKSIVDGIIELSLVRSGRKAIRYLSVVKMERRRISTESIPIEIDRHRGLVFRVSRFGFLKKKLTKALTPGHNKEDTGAKVRHDTEGPTPRTPGPRQHESGSKSAFSPP